VSGRFRRPSAQPSNLCHNRTSQLNIADSFERTISQICGGVGLARQPHFIPCSAVLSVSTSTTVSTLRQAPERRSLLATPPRPSGTIHTPACTRPLHDAATALTGGAGVRQSARVSAGRPNSAGSGRLKRPLLRDDYRRHAESREARDTTEAGFRKRSCVIHGQTVVHGDKQQ
jgi:hypothetical protein